MPAIKPAAKKATAGAANAAPKLTLQSLLNNERPSTLSFIGDTTEKGNPIFSDGTTELPIAKNLLLYMVREKQVTVKGDSISSEEGFTSKGGTWNVYRKWDNTEL